MKYLATFIVIMSFVEIGIFGLVIFDHGTMDGSNSDCTASVVDGSSCSTSIMDMALHHISVLQTLTTVLPVSSNWFLLLASLLPVSVAIFPFYKNLLLPKLELLPQRLRELTLHSLHRRQKIVSWLSLFELSPAL